MNTPTIGELMDDMMGTILAQYSVSEALDVVRAEAEEAFYRATGAPSAPPVYSAPESGIPCLMAPFCELGGKVVKGEDVEGGKCCTTSHCACSYNGEEFGKPLTPATTEDTNKFWAMMRAQAEQSMYEAQYDL
jgi:hypothetical protein